ncbi:tyrosine-type recombinase/integrase [Arthrobacter sp. CP30]
MKAPGTGASKPGRIEPGSLGSIQRAKLGPEGLWHSSGRYKNLDGKWIQRQYSGKTARSAERAVLRSLSALREADHEGWAKRNAPVEPDVLRFSDVIQLWIVHIQESNEVRASTAAEYVRVCRQDILPALGQLPVQEITVASCARYLHSIPEGQRLRRKAAINRVVLSSLCKWAAGQGAMTWNPVRDVSRLPAVQKREVNIIEAVDVAAFLSAVRSHCEAPPCRPGPKANLDVPDGVELLLATGVRISELLGLRWCDVDIDRPDGPYKLFVNGKVGMEKGKGIVRHNFIKNSRGQNELQLDSRVAETLRRRRATQTGDNPNGAIFPARNGSWMQPANWRGRWRVVRTDLASSLDVPQEVDLATVTPHTFRRTLGTMLAEAVGVEVAQKQLGHISPAETLKSYVRDRRRAPDSTDLMQAMMRGTQASVAPNGKGQEAEVREKLRGRI